MLQVHPDQTVQEVRKQARKLAMTGGYEVALTPHLSSTELEALVDIWTEALDAAKKGTAEYKSSIAYRILDLVLMCENSSQNIREAIQQVKAE